MIKILNRLLCLIGLHGWTLDEIDEGRAVYHCEHCRKVDIIDLYGR